jgi:SAM-dependent methyltransferase
MHEAPLMAPKSRKPSRPEPLFAGDESEPQAGAVSTYAPLPSVWFGTDAELLEQMLDFYPHKQPKAILDATVNAGRFWRGSTRKVVGMDINPKFEPDIIADNSDMPCKTASFDVVVYDPPHVPNQGKDRSKDFNDRFGLVGKSPAETGYNFTHTFRPFLLEAFRVLRKDGVLFCKIADYVHGHRFQWAHIEIINAAVAVGFTPCDCIVKIRKGPITDPRWKKAHHARRQHCYWIVLRKSNKCE